MDEDEAKHYDEEFRAGGVVVTVNAGDRYTEAADTLRDSGGQTFQPAADAARVAAGAGMIRLVASTC